MAYTPFAVFAASMLFLLFISPLDLYPDTVHQDIQASETAQTFHHSFENGFSNGFGESVNQYMITFNDNVSSEGPLNDAEDEFNTNYSMSSSNYFSMDELENNIIEIFQDDRRNINFSTGDSVTFDAEGLKINSKIDLNYNLTDPITGITRRYSQRFSTEASINGSIDPLTNYTAEERLEYRYCGYESPAVMAGSGSGSASELFGYAVVKPDDQDSIADKENKIILLESADNEDEAVLDEYKAVIVEDNSYNDGDYIQDFNQDQQFYTGQNIILIDDYVYISYFREIIDNQCFIEADDAPDIFQRMENDNSGSVDGILTFIEDTSSEGEPNEDYYYFDSDRSASNPVNITGVSSSDLDERSWFSVEQVNMDYWNLTNLIE